MRINNLTIDEKISGRTVIQTIRALNRNIPDSRLYKACRSGEVRVNGSRVKFNYRLKINDVIRVPVFKPEQKVNNPLPDLLQDAIIFEDENIIAINKPSGLSVHAGSQGDLGLIEILRQDKRWLNDDLDLIHRLDAMTSGVILVAKNYRAKKFLSEQFRLRNIEKHYWAILEGHFPKSKKLIESRISLSNTSKDFRVYCDDKGKYAKTLVLSVEHLFCSRNKPITKILLFPKTGRKHQLRVQCSSLGHPILGDTIYGSNFKVRLLLHAFSIKFEVPGCGEFLKLSAGLPEEFYN